jgi:hypothetical protein
MKLLGKKWLRTPHCKHKVVQNPTAHATRKGSRPAFNLFKANSTIAVTKQYTEKIGIAK